MAATPTALRLSARIAGTDDAGSWKANAYVVKSELDLYNNFTYFLTNPVLGDQFHQHDDRVMAGGNASRTLNGSFAGRPMETTFGIQTRYDDIDLGADRHLSARVPRPMSAATRSARAASASMPRTPCTGPTGCGPRWACAAITMPRRSIRSSTPTIPATSSAAIGSPKFTMVLGPVQQDRIFRRRRHRHAQQRRARRHHHRRADRSRRTKLSASPLLVRTKGAEVGVRSKLIPGLDSSLSLFLLDQDSEIVFNGDAGDTSASRPSRRYGVEWTNNYRPIPGSTLDADLALIACAFRRLSTATRPRSMPRSPDFRRRRSATRPAITFPTRRRWWRPPASRSARRPAGSARLRWRYLGVEPAHRRQRLPLAGRPASSTAASAIGFDNGWRIQLDALNLLNTKANQITYAYGSLIKTDSLYNHVLSRWATDRAGRGVPERRDGLCAASDRAAGGPADAGGQLLAVLCDQCRCMV